ncbi:hypothetical protein AHAS_Ahas05G0240100 [Arachis hypogaea]
MINGLCKEGLLNEALALMSEMEDHGFSPDAVTYETIIRALLEKGLCKEGLFEEALALLSESEDNGCLPNIVTFETVIRALFEKDENDMAEKLLWEMIARGLLNDSFKLRIKFKPLHHHIIVELHFLFVVFEFLIRGGHGVPVPDSDYIQNIQLRSRSSSNSTSSSPESPPKSLMENLMGLLRVRIKRGVNLAVRDVRSSDPYVVIKMGKQKLKTRVIKRDVNPEWNEDLTLSVVDPHASVSLTIYDHDTFSKDDKMGDAEFEILPFIEALKMNVTGLPNGTVVKRIQQSRDNYLADESRITYINGKLVQDMILRLRNVECGELEIQLNWIDLPGSKGL